MNRTPVISLGAGVQSSTLLLMAAHGELDDLGRPPLAVFADTQWEPPEVMEWLPFLRTMAYKAGIEVVTVTAGDLRANTLRAASGEASRASNPPFFTRNPDGSKGFTLRQCTRDYKVRPIERELRRRGYGKVRPVESWLGISLDETERMKPNPTPWIETRWPLIELEMRRSDCLAWMREHGYPEPPKSACVGCPYHRNRKWLDMRENQPEQWADAVEFDRSIRQMPGMDGTAYLHKDCVPLDEAVLDLSDVGQMTFGAECEGMCGV